MTSFPDGPGVDLSGVFTPDSRCGALLRELGPMIRAAVEAGQRLEDRPLVAGHLRQLRFAEDRLSAALIKNMQVTQGSGKAEFPSSADRPSSERKPDKGLSTTRAATLMEVSARTVRNMIDRGQLEGWRVRGGARRADAGSVAEWISERDRNRNDQKA